ncbi:MAG: type 4a pilus biogenesis protein PilO [Deltaproteobacteria bacterium]|nr:type 4a pilus biogenesis protein PilO [Deltaproteobacteria bacterium]
MTLSGILKSIPNLDMGSLFAFKREFVIAAAAAFIVFFSYRFVYIGNVEVIKNIDAKINAGRSEIGRIRAEIQAGEALKAALSRAQADLDAVEKGLRSLNERLPSDKQISRILYSITVNGSGGGVRIISIKPMQPEEKEGLIRIPLQINAEGRFAATGDYIERIENLPRIITVDNFLIESKDGAGYVSSRVFMSAYILGR